MRPPRRSRSRSRSRSGVWLAVVVGVVLLTAIVSPFAGGPSDAFTSGTLDRSSTVGVADDAGGLVGLDVSSAVAAGSSSRLVTVTNQFDHTVTATVSLQGSAGSLSNEQATLAPGETLTTTVSVACDSTPDTVSFTVTATDSSRVTATATRSTTVDTSDCSATTGPLEFVSGSATTDSVSGPGGSSTGSLEFSMQNTRSTAGTIVGFELREVGTATTLSFEGPPPVNAEAGKDEVYIDATGGPTDSEGAAEPGKNSPGYDIGSGTKHPLDQSVTLDAGETADVVLYQFVSNGQPDGFATGDQVEITFSFQDGSEATVSFTV
ncbi:MAG: hypothetical protein V5A41_14595 [Haloarculaceae archaeon]